MKKLFLFVKKPGFVFYMLALMLIFLSFFVFQVQINSYIKEDMHAQIEAIQKNSVLLIQNELTYLKGLTTSVAQMVSRIEIQSDEDLLQALRDYADTSHVVRTLFVTLEGHAYTNYAGYLGQSDANMSLDGIRLSEITEPVFSQPYYDENLGEVIFGVIAPTTMGEKQGVLISSYNVKGFSDLLDHKLMGDATEVGILNNKGEVISGRNADEFKLNIFDSLSQVKFKSLSAETMRSDFASGKSGFSIYCTSGLIRYCSYAPVELNDWYVIVIIKESALRSKLANLERYGVQLTVELIVVMLTLLALISANRMREQKKIRIMLENAARLDGLTSIYNRKAIQDAIDQSLADAEEDSCATLLIIDVDDFKTINDQRGHLFGDKVLKACADNLACMFGGEGIVGRIGGDEFAVFLQDGRDAEEITNKINALIHHFYVPTEADEKQKISVSVGIVQAKSRESSFLELYQLSDAALYRAKQTGKGQLSN